MWSRQMLEEIAGTACVWTGGEAAALLGENKSPVQAKAPGALVRLTTAEQVEKIVELARREHFPLVPVSTAGAHYHGGTAPQAENAVVVDLSQMNRIVHIDRSERIAIVEPGVTYGQLLEALKKEGMTISMPLGTRKEKSVLTSALESEPRLNSLHQWNFLDPLRCMEVIWGDGRRVFTGDAAMGPKDLEKQWEAGLNQWEPSGPFMVDFYRMLTGAQGTMGIVTWASLHCELLAGAEENFVFCTETLKELEDFSYELLRRRYGDAYFILNRERLALLMGQPGAAEQLPAWTAVLRLAGRHFLPEEKVAYQREDVAELAESFGLAPQKKAGDFSADEIMAKAEGIMDAPTQGGSTGLFREIFFVTTQDRAGRYVKSAAQELAAAGLPEERLAVYLQPDNMGTSVRLYLSVCFGAEEADAAGAWFHAASRRLCDEGAYYLRPYGEWAGLQMAKDPESLKLLKEMKQIFDPDGILNPGKVMDV